MTRGPDSGPADSGPEVGTGEPEEHRRLLAALGGPVSDLLPGFGPLLADPPRLAPLLVRMIDDPRSADCAEAAGAISFGIQFLPEAERWPLARRLVGHRLAEVRRSFYRHWTNTRMYLQGRGRRLLPEGPWLELLAVGLGDDDAEVRGFAATQVFHTALGARFAPELLASLERSAPSAVHWATLLALGSATCEASLEVLRGHLAGPEEVLASAALRALAARPEGRPDWEAAFHDPRPFLRDTASYARCVLPDPAAQAPDAGSVLGVAIGPGGSPQGGSGEHSG